MRPRDPSVTTHSSSAPTLMCTALSRFCFLTGRAARAFIAPSLSPSSSTASQVPVGDSRARRSTADPQVGPVLGAGVERRLVAGHARHHLAERRQALLVHATQHAARLEAVAAEL